MKSDKIMLCPLCKAELIVEGQARLETLDEHICNPNNEPCLKDRYVCSNKSCTSHLHNMCWERDGEMYGRTSLPLSRLQWGNPNFIFMDENSAPFNSFWRKIYNEDKKDGDEYYVLPWLTEKLGFRIVANKWRRYDDDCVLLDFGTSYSITTRQGECCGTPHYGINGWHMFRFSIGQYVKERKWNKNFTLKYRGDMDENEWWRVCAYKVKYFVEKYWYKSNPDYKGEQEKVKKEARNSCWNSYYDLTTINEKEKSKNFNKMNQMYIEKKITYNKKEK